MKIRLREHTEVRATRSRRRRRPRAGRAVLAVSALALGFVQLVAPPAGAATTTLVSLAFDNGSISQYNLGFVKALQPHNATATFFVNSGTVGASGNFVSWTQLATMAAAGQDIGGKTVNATNLTTDTNPSGQVCNDRAALLQHGLQPASFAYPGGATNTTVQGIVQACGYGNGRTAGSLSPAGPTWAETLPPKNWLATRAYAPTGQVSLANLQALVNGAASHNGGWSQIVLGKVCSQAQDPANFSSCSTSSGWIDLADLNTFLDWMANAGQTGGAPAGASLTTVRAALASADTSAPTTTITCNDAPCANTPYTGVVTVKLAATDLGTSVAATRFTTDGSDPDTTSPLYTGPFTVNGATSNVTIKYRSWDYAGNAEAVKTQVIQAPSDSAAPTTTIACNTTTCSSTPYVSTVSVSLSATDTGGSGVAATYYTTDGSTPTTSSPTYTAPFTLDTPGTYDVKFFSTDKAGNAEAVQTQQIKVVPVTTKVSLTFDNGTVSQYTLGFQQALQPHAANATFFVNSGTVNNSANIMTWSQLSALAAAGNDIGGKTVNATNLTTDPNPTNQVCNDRTALQQHGLDPVAFAYPGGAFNTTVEGIVKSCGYGSGRSAGSLSPAGPTYAETLVPRDWYATRAYAPTGQVTLANMKALVTGASTHGGGWSQIVIGRVCSQSADPNNYTACSASAGWIELADLNAFLDWMGSAGQSGGAPAGAALSTVRAAAIAADAVAPVTTAACNGDACASTTYTSTVYVTLSSTDVGSSVSSTHFTTDGSDPTLSSPTYSGRIPVTGTETLKYRSWDNAGNAEATNTLTVNVDQPADTTAPTTTAACDGNPCTTTGYNGSTTVTLSATDSGWGVDKTYYTTDGSQPTVASTVYTTGFKLATAGDYDVKFFSTDLAGNQETVQTQHITVLPPKVTVSLTFDDGLLTQYELAAKRALAPHHLSGTFYDVTGLNDVDEQHMTWAQMHDLNNLGNEIGGHTVHHVSLKGLDSATVTAEVCGSYQDLVNHGFYPTSFAYPTGAYDAQAESIVKSCGYTSGRAAGGLDVAGDGAGPVYTETLPPKDVDALRTLYDAPAGSPPNVPPLSLSHLESAVTAAAQHGGGWLPLVFHEVCSQQYDPSNYNFCISDWGPIELDTLNAFLDWLNNSGQPGGAPARTVVQTVSQVIDGPDTQTPITTLNCNGSACDSSTYHGSVSVTLAAKDPGGSGVAGTYYTTDGSTPTTASPKFTRPFIITANTSFRFFSVDNAGNVEPTQTQLVLVSPNTDPVIGAAGDIACDPDAPAFNGGLGTATDCRASHTVNLLDGVDAVLPLGDVQYNCGGPAAFAQSYDPTWGLMKPITHPVPGGEDFATTGGTDCPTTPGAGYFQYFGAAAGDPSKGYYSYDLGQWHIVAVNTAPCEEGNAAWCASGSQMDQWLQQDLAANSSSCTLAYYQNPRWGSNASGSNGDSTYQAIWQDLYNGGADVVLNGDDHWYERFQPLDGNGAADPNGLRQFIVGTGGAGLDTPGVEQPTSQVLDNSTHGVMRMTLHNGSYDWKFVPDEGTFTDSGTANCHGKPDAVAPASTIACNGANCSPGWYTNTVQVSLAATDNTGGSGVSKTYYTTDGSTPTTSSTAYTAPFPVATTSTVKYFSVDNNGNAEAVQSQPIQIDSSPPGTTAACNNLACSGWYAGSAQVSLTSTDNAGGSGVSKIYYTTNGTTPTTASAVYSAPLNVTTTSTIKFFAVDVAGNAEPVNSQLVQVDAAAPVSTIRCNNAACAATPYQNSVSITLSATDTGGSGLANIRYTTDGTDPTASSTAYTAAFSLTSTATVKYRAWDVAGNAEAVKSQVVNVGAESAPVAKLTVTPSTGAAPTTVTADASGSTDTDPWPIANYTFNWGDGSAAQSTTAKTLTHNYTRTGTFTVTVTVTDTANLSSTATAQVVIRTNLIANSTFDSNTTGWATGDNSVSLTRVTNQKHSGPSSAQIQNTGFTSRTCALTDSPNVVGKTAAGTYTASLWVRAGVSGATLTLQLRELNGSTLVGSASATVRLSTTWQLVQVSYTVKQPGVTALDYTASVPSVGGLTTAFFADDASLWLN
jgi:peptidoglycan/xylan/chitin deacetylase (PgdA/CDA1 family)